MRKIRPHQIATGAIDPDTGEEVVPPPGSVGIVGEDGTLTYQPPPAGAMRFRGLWSPAPTDGAYGLGHVVLHDGGVWVAAQAGAVGEPLEANAAWQLVERSEDEAAAGGILLLEAGETAPPPGTPYGTVVARKASV